MSTNYIVISNSDSIEGTLAIEKSVFRDIAKQTLSENKFINVSNDMMQNKRIAVTYEEGKLLLDIDVEVKFGNRTIGVIENVQKKIFETITNATSVTDVTVNINVLGFIF